MNTDKLKLGFLVKKRGKANDKGQALVETLLFFPVLLLCLVGLTFFSRLFLAWIVLNQATKYGVGLIVHANYNEVKVKEELADFLTKEKLIKSIKRDDIKVDLGGGWHGAAYVEISCRLEVPRLLRNIPGFPYPFVLSARCECYNDSWYFGFPNDISQS